MRLFSDCFQIDWTSLTINPEVCWELGASTDRADDGTHFLVHPSWQTPGQVSLPTASPATLIHCATMSGANTAGQANVRIEFQFRPEIWYREHLWEVSGPCGGVYVWNTSDLAGLLSRLDTSTTWYSPPELIHRSEHWAEHSNIHTVQCFLSFSPSLSVGSENSGKLARGLNISRVINLHISLVKLLSSNERKIKTKDNFLKDFWLVSQTKT